MPKFKVTWRMEGTAEVDADDATEAEQIVEENLPNLDSSLLESFDVDECEADSEGAIDDGS